MKHLTMMVMAAVSCVSLAAIPAGAADLATPSIKASPSTIARGGHGSMIVTISIVPNAHVNAHIVPDPSFIPTNFAASGAAGVSVGAPKYPAGKSASSYGIKESVYEGTAAITVPLTVSSSATPGPVTVGGKLTFQACNASVCFPPKTISLTTTVTVK